MNSRKKSPKISTGSRSKRNNKFESANAEAKLRRLKIQENLLQATATSAVVEQHLKALIREVDTKRYLHNVELRNSVEDVKTQFDQFQHNISSPECLSRMDIEEYKKLALDLDDKILSFKRYVDRELNILRIAEISLAAELQVQAANAQVTRSSPDNIMKTYTAMVPSTVKNIQNTQSVCKEVKKLEDFISATGPRGGWGEREHALFVSRRRHCIPRRTAGSGYCDHDDRSPRMDKLLRLLQEYIEGITLDDIVEHENWYSEYMRLKAEQQAVLKQWREKKNLARQPFRGIEVQLVDDENKWQVIKAIRPKTTPKRTEEEAKTDIAHQTGLVNAVPQNSSNNDITDQQDSQSDMSKTEVEDEEAILNLNENEENSHQESRITKPLNEKPDNVMTTDSDTKTQDVIKKEKEKNTNTNQRYMQPTMVWTIKSVKDDPNVAKNDFRLHIPMWNAPKLGIANWRRCLVEDLS